MLTAEGTLLFLCRGRSTDERGGEAWNLSCVEGGKWRRSLHGEC